MRSTYLGDVKPASANLLVVTWTRLKNSSQKMTKRYSEDHTNAHIPSEAALSNAFFTHPTEGLVIKDDQIPSNHNTETTLCKHHSETRSNTYVAVDQCPLRRVSVTISQTACNTVGDRIIPTDKGALVRPPLWWVHPARGDKDIRKHATN